MCPPLYRLGEEKPDPGARGFVYLGHGDEMPSFLRPHLLPLGLPPLPVNWGRPGRAGKAGPRGGGCKPRRR